MSSASHPTPTKFRLQVSAYDRASSWLVAFLVISAGTVGALLLLYFASRMGGVSVAPAVTAVGGGGGGQGGSGDTASGAESDLDTVSPADVPDLSQSQLDNTLSALSAVVTEKTELLTNDVLDTQSEIHGTDPNDRRSPGFGTGRGGGFGTGVGRGVGSGTGDGYGPGSGGPPEPKREFRFEPADLNEYAEMLDFFQVELGVLSQADNKVYYASNLRREAPTVRIGSPGDEQRMFMNPTAGQFSTLDRRLAGKAGIAARGQIIMQFYPPATQAIINDLEQKFAATRGRKPNQIRRTVFRVTHTGDRFDLKVEEQSYR